MAPFVVIYGVLFVYPTIKMVRARLHQRAADRPGQMGGPRQFPAALGDRLFSTAIWNTFYFVALSVIPAPCSRFSSRSASTG